MTCTATTTGPLALPCRNTDPHEPHRGCQFISVWVADGRHDDDFEDVR